jgi:hypothetical protein
VLQIPKSNDLAGDLMAAIPISPLPPVPADQIVRQFRQLEAEWKAETEHLSSSTKIMGHHTLQEIVAMGCAVVPLMLGDLRRGPCLWVWALPELTGADPVAPVDRGDIAKMTEAWLHWADGHGYQR